MKLLSVLPVMGVAMAAMGSVACTATPGTEDPSLLGAAMSARKLDPFAAASCTGTELTAQVDGLEAENDLGTFAMRARSRSCDGDRCTAWAIAKQVTFEGTGGSGSGMGVAPQVDSLSFPMAEAGSGLTAPSAPVEGVLASFKASLHWQGDRARLAFDTIEKARWSSERGARPTPLRLRCDGGSCSLHVDDQNGMREMQLEGPSRFAGIVTDKCFRYASTSAKESDGGSRQELEVVLYGTFRLQ